jgi:arylsulfatase A-like enzyme
MVAPRRHLRAAAIMLAATCLSACGGRSTPPNIVLVSIDCLNARQLEDAIARGTMPTVAALAAHAIDFTRAYANAPWTTPSHMSMLTGLYPSQHGRDASVHLLTQVNNFYDRVPHFRTLADYLREQGYETVAFVGTGSISAQFGLGQGFQVFHESPRNGTDPDFPGTREALHAWLDGRKPSPFFLFVHTYDLHMPRPAGYGDEKNALRLIDQYVADLLTQLRDRGLYDHTAILLTGDHGSNMVKTEGKCCSHGVGHYEENLHVPLLLKLPAASEGRHTDVLVQHVDILPTVLELAGVSATGYIGAGQSLLHALKDGKTSDRFSYSEADAACTTRRALVNDRYKYIYTSKDEQQMLFQLYWRFSGLCPASCFTLPVEEFFDLSTDPFEERNLLPGPLDAEQTKWLERFRQEMVRDRNLPHAYTVRVVTDNEQSGSPPVVQAVQKALKSLGYVQ